MIINKNYFSEFIRNNISHKTIPYKKKILITGSSGFIGQYLVQCLVETFDEKQLQVVGLDRIRPKFKNKNFKFIKKDLYKLNRKNIPNLKFDYIIHLAGIPSPVYYKQYPLKTIYLNSELTRELLEKSKKQNSKFIFFSSSEIYGNPFKKFIPTNEDYLGNVSCISDRSCYDESKRMGETYTYIFKNNFDVNAKIIRPFNFYGDGMRINDERIIPRFFNQSYKNKNLTVFSNGKQTRSYCHIYDAVVMMINIIFNGKKFVYNVGNPTEEVNATTLAKKILKITDNKLIKIKRIPYPRNYPSDEPKRRCPSIKNYTSEFKFKPTISLSQGLEYFNDYAKLNFK